MANEDRTNMNTDTQSKGSNKKLLAGLGIGGALLVGGIAAYLLRPKKEDWGDSITFEELMAEEADS